MSTIDDSPVSAAEPASAEVAIERRSGSPAVHISNAVVQVYRAQVGRGPTRARTIIDHNLVIVELRDTLTPGERNLVAAGDAHAVGQTRRAYRRLVHAPLIAAVEEILGRTVVALLSDTRPDADIAVEVFVLAP